MAVSKLKPVEDIMEAYRAGQRLFGENYAAELRDKQVLLPTDIEWHFIGHLQSKQLKYYIPFVSMIHGVDSLQHLLDVDKAAQKAGRHVNILLQIHVAAEETKFGFSPDELRQLQNQLNPASLLATTVCGVMGMATNTDDYSRVRNDFRNIRSSFDTLRNGLFKQNSAFCEVSMGMSHDYRIAIDEGSTIVRLGASVFGPRNYPNQ